MTTSAKLLALVAALAAISIPGAPAQARVAKHPRCSAAGRHLLKAKGRVLVYERPSAHRNDSGDPEDGVFACMRSNGASHLLGYDDVDGDDGEYGPESALLGVTITGRFVAAQFVTGADEAEACSKYSGPEPFDCPSPQTTIHVVAADSGRAASIRLTATTGGPATIAMSSAGAIAWVDNGLRATHLRPAGVHGLTHAAALLDAGPIDARSLAFAGPTLSWTTGGVAHSAMI